MRRALHLAADAYLEALPVCHWLARADPEPALLAVSREIEAITGLTPEFFTASPRAWLEHVHPDDADALRAALRGADEASGQAEFRFRHRDGGYRWLRAAFRRIVAQPGAAPLLVGTCQEIEAERQAAREVELWASAVEHAEVALSLVGLDGRIVHVNEANARLLDRPAGELVGQHVGVLLPPEQSGETEAMLALLAREGALHRELPNVRLDGSAFWVALSARLARDRAGEPLCIVATVRDLSAELERLETLNASALALTAAPGEEILTTIARLARTLTGARYAALGVVHEGRLVRFIPDGLGEAEIAAIGRWPAGHGLLGTIIHEGRTIRVPRIDTDPRSAGFPPGHPPMTSFLGVPIAIGDAVYGHLYLTDKQGAPEFSFADERLAELFAAHAAVAIRDAERLEQLRESEAELREAQRIARLGRWERNVPRNELRWSGETHEIFGNDPEAFGGTYEAFLALVHPDDREAVDRSVQRALAGGPAHSVDHRIVRLDGSERVVHEEAVVTFDEAGRPLRIVGTVQDITERKRAQEARRAVEERYRTLVEEASDGIFLADAQGRHLAVNAAACALLGYTREELLGMRLQDLLPPGEIKARPIRWEELRAGRVLLSERPLRRKDGLLVPVEISAKQLPDGTLQAIVRDISGRQRAEEARTRLAAAIEQTADAVMVTDPGGTIVYVNAAFERASRYARHELLGQNPRLLKSGQHDDAFYRQMWETLAAGRSWSGVIANRRRDGTLLEEEVVISPIRGESGTTVGYVELSRDVTRERELEEQLRQAHKMEGIGRLAGGIAHDFNNILTAIGGYAAFLLEDLPPRDPRRATVGEIARGVEHATALTAQLLAFSRRQILRSVAVDLNRVLRGLEPLLRWLLGEQILLSAALAEDLGAVRADPTQLEQVLLNLAVNARDAMPGGGRLTIETANVELDAAYAAAHAEVTPGQYVMLAVSDSGVGMDATTQGRIFEPFFTTKEPGKGTGLGLSTVYGIVKQSGGEIRVYSEPGHGTTFKIYLPHVDEPAAAAPAERAEPAALGGSETILVAEDEPAVRALIVTVLERYGYAVLEAAGGDEAISVAGTQAGAIALLVTDVVMPGMSGRELATRLFASRPGLRVLYASGYTENAVVDHGVLEPGIDFLHKPFTPDALARTVRRILDAPSPDGD